jgi:hypothetical protein
MTDIHTLPRLLKIPTTAFSSRHGIKPTLIALHRWDGGTFESVVKMFVDSPHDASGKSSTFVYAGERGPDSGKFAQMIRIANKPWTQAGWNPHCISIECADGIWIGDDHDGFHRLAHIVAGLCHYEQLHPRWVYGAGLLKDPKGFTRHHDLGVLGGNHPQCPTTSRPKMEEFSLLVKREYAKGGFRTREEWGLL